VKRCPSCATPNRPDAVRCVCGHELASTAAAVSGPSSGTPVTIVKGPRRVLFLAGLVALGAAGVGLTIVVPSVARTGIPANEASAIRLLRTINGAEKVYWERCRGYAPDLAALQTTGALVLRDDQHGSLTKNGYTVAVKASKSAFAVQNAVGECAGSVTEYVVRANPVTVGTTGSRYFATDQHGAVYQSAIGPVSEPIDSAALVN